MNPGAATWSFDEQDLNAITRTVSSFLSDTGAHSALIADRAGQLVATVGQPLKFDPTVFATLTAADFSTNDQLARLIGETDFTTLFHQGEKESMYVADVARRLILVTLFDNRTPIGLVRLKMKPVVEELTAHLDRVVSRSREGGKTQPNILAGAGDEIDELFNW
ncbi:MAG: roadblock/LC7 domain-containing protein [Gemmatimonadaceae bacterium]|nr:roadblock/LC7 domain-containing protein [Gemmatimonadaceae bacterium]MDQ3242575.1 roadblock/LC7 domain-containing protein [Gemmatimonadota bacterium]